MLSAANKLRQILTRREKLQVGALLVAIIVMAFSQTIGVASVLPFISLVMDPTMIFENRWLLWAYETFNFTSLNRFIIFAGVVMFFIIVFSNGISAFTTWFKLRFAWMNNHRLSKRLLGKYLSMPFVFFLNQNSADLSKNILADVNNLTTSYLIPLLIIITRVMIAILILAMLFWVNVIVLFVALIMIGGAYGVLFWRVNKKLKFFGKLRLQANKMRFKTVSNFFLNAIPRNQSCGGTVQAPKGFLASDI